MQRFRGVGVRDRETCRWDSGGQSGPIQASCIPPGDTQGAYPKFSSPLSCFEWASYLQPRHQLWHCLRSLPPLILNPTVNLLTLYTSVSLASHFQKQNVKKGRGKHFLCNLNECLALGGQSCLGSTFKETQTSSQRHLKSNSDLHLNLSRHCKKRTRFKLCRLLKNPAFLFSLPFPRAPHPPNLYVLALMLPALSALWSLGLPTSFSAIHYIDV